jgi:hypothetical protein
MSEWGPWIEHDGKGCPCVGQFVEVVRRSGDVLCGIAGEECIRNGISPNEPGSGWVWILAPGFEGGWFVRYRIRRPRGMEVLDHILANLDQPVTEDA